jgi:hypothetical protein
MTEVARSQPCPCGSGKKYKRCCGEKAAPILGTPKNPMGQGGMPGGFDPNSLDPAMIQEFQSMFGKLPMGQKKKFQEIMQKAMAGKDVTKDAEALEKNLPAEFQSLFEKFKLPEMDPAANAHSDNSGNGNMDAEQAKQVVRDALAKGEITEEEANKLLSVQTPSATVPPIKEESRFKKLWKGLNKGK